MDNIIIMRTVDILFAIIELILTGLVAYGFKILISKVKNDRIKSALESLQDAVSVTVRELNNNFVKEWKKTGDGKLTAKQIEELKLVDLVIEDLKKGQSEKDTYDDKAGEERK